MNSHKMTPFSLDSNQNKEINIVQKADTINLENQGVSGSEGWSRLRGSAQIPPTGSDSKDTSLTRALTIQQPQDLLRVATKRFGENGGDKDKADDLKHNETIAETARE